MSNATDNGSFSLVSRTRAGAESARMPEQALLTYEKHQAMADGNLYSIINDILQ